MEYLSASRIESFRQCPLHFYFRYLEKANEMDRTTDFYADYGSMAHEILEKLGKKEINKIAALMEFEKNYPYCHVPEELTDRYLFEGKKMIERKADELPTLDILGVELEFTELIEFGIPPIHGFIDLIYRDRRGLVIRDYKTSKPFSSSDKATKMQPSIYALATERIFGEKPYRFEFDHILENEMTSYLIDDNFMFMAKIKLQAAWNEIKASQYEGCFSPFYCESFCSHRSICPVYMKKLGI